METTHLQIPFFLYTFASIKNKGLVVQLNRMQDSGS